MYSGVTVGDFQAAGTSDEAKAAVNSAAKAGALIPAFQPFQHSSFPAFYYSSFRLSTFQSSHDFTSLNRSAM